jgi:hypothetical protein
MPARRHTLSYAIEGVEGLYRPAPFPPFCPCVSLARFWSACGQPSWIIKASAGAVLAIPVSPCLVQDPAGSSPAAGCTCPPARARRTCPMQETSGAGPPDRVLWLGPRCGLCRPRFSLVLPDVRRVASSPGQFVWSVRLLVQPSQSRREGADARLSPCRQHSAQHCQPGVTRGRAKGVTGHKRARRDSTESMSPVCCLPAGKLRLVAFSGIACCLAMPPSLRP